MKNETELNLKFSVEKTDDNHLLVRKTNNNQEFEVKLYVFTREDIESYQNYQKEIYDELNASKVTSNKIFGFLDNIFGH